MKTKTTIILVIAFFMVFAASVSAQEMGAFSQGKWELTLVGSGSSDESFDGTTLSTEAAIGYFISDNLELVVRQGIAYADRPGDDDWNGSTRGGIDFHFGFDPLYPFIGANFGMVYGDTVKEQFIAGPEAGLKCLVNDTTFLFGMIEYQFLFDDADEADDNFDDGRFVYSLGIGFTF